MNKQRTHSKRGANARRPRNAYALVVVLTVSTVTSIVLLGTIRAASVELGAQVNAFESDRADYIAQAAVQHGVAIVEEKPNWAGTIKNVRFSKNSEASYSITIEQTKDQTLVHGATSVGGMTGEMTIVIEKESPKEEETKVLKGKSKGKGKQQPKHRGSSKGKRK